MSQILEAIAAHFTEIGYTSYTGTNCVHVSLSKRKVFGSVKVTITDDSLVAVYDKMVGQKDKRKLIKLICRRDINNPQSLDLLSSFISRMLPL